MTLIVFLIISASCLLVFAVFREKRIPAIGAFDWSQAEPIKYRPFKSGPFKMAMGLSEIPAHDFLLIEKTYKSLCSLRFRLFESHRNDLIFLHPSAAAALEEFYDFVVSYMCARYPQYFTRKEKTVFNSITKSEFPAEAKYCTHDKMLHVLATNLEEDFLILVKNGSGAYKDEYVLRAGAALFPSGFNPGRKANKPLTAIHTPVPQYKRRLKGSMNNFFKKVKVGQFSMRNNWSIQTHEKLCALTENHATPNEKVEPLDPQTVHFDKVFLRCERQVVTRLPKSKAVVFTIRTYLTPLSELKLEDGVPERLCSAIDELPDDMAAYKRRTAWGEAVKAYLRGQAEGL